LVDDLTDWLRGTLDSEDLWDDPTSAREVVKDRLDELAVAASAVPFDVVVLTTEPAWSLRPTEPRDAFLVDLLAHANERVSTVSGQVHAIVAGRVLDLTGAPAPARGPPRLQRPRTRPRTWSVRGRRCRCNPPASVGRATALPPGPRPAPLPRRRPRPDAEFLLHPCRPSPPSCRP